MKAVQFSILFIAVASGCGNPPAVRDADVLRAAPLYGFNERELDLYLRWLVRQRMDPAERVVLLARKNIGQPYRLFLLGEHPFELYDPDPMYCLSAGDCVTFVEHTYAMALSHDWPSFFRTLQRIRYKDGVIGLLTRNHFIEADWNINNAWLFDEITSSLPGGETRPMRTRIDRAAFFARFGLHEEIPVEMFEGTYVPRERLTAVLDDLCDGDIVEIVRGNARAQYVSHVGLIMHDRNGAATILHSASPAVREESLQSYMQHHSDVIGLKFLRMTTRTTAE